MVSERQGRNLVNNIVLMYHDIYYDVVEESGFNTPGANYYKVSFDVFQEHISMIAQMIKENKLRQHDVVFTFDDGGISSYTHVAPLLEKYGFTGHFFIVTDSIGKNNFMSEAQVRDLSDRNHIIGSHSSSHPSNIQNLTLSEKSMEWKKSISKLESIIGKNVMEISIPNGYFSYKDIELYNSLGIHTVYTSKLGECSQYEDISVLGRFAITRHTSNEQIKKALTCNAFVYGVRIQQNLLSLLKIILGNNYIKLKKIVRKWF